MAEYSLTPVKVTKVNTKFRTIKTALPVPQSLPVFEELRRSEPRSMSGQPPILWHKADDYIVSDKWGNPKLCGKGYFPFFDFCITNFYIRTDVRMLCVVCTL